MNKQLAVHADICVVGGGIMGLLTARELLLAGKHVAIIEAGDCGKEASWAGGGIVSPLYPWRYADPVTSLADWAQSYYPQLCEALAVNTAIDCELQRSGLLLLDVHDLELAQTWANQQQRQYQCFNGDDYLFLQPELITNGNRSIYFPDVAQVRNPRLMKALKWDVLQRGAQLLEQEPLESFEQQRNSIVSARTAQREVFASQYVICAGAWSANILRSLSITIEVKPIRGQMLMFASHQHSLRHIVLKNGRYLIPRKDGRILCGSTVEDVGFDKATTIEAYQTLVQAAMEIMPSLSTQVVEMHWSGLRPGSSNGIPFIGQIPTTDNLYINAGQFRNGVVLAPASARLLADLILGRAPIVDPAPYRVIPAPISVTCNASPGS